MLREILTIGDKIDIKPLDKSGRPLHNTRIFASQFIDFVDFDIINISAPIVYGRAIPLAAGEFFNLCFYTNKGLYQCNCTAISNYKDNNTVVTVVRVINNLEKLQRRQFFRLECIIDIEYRIIRKEEEILEEKLLKNDFNSVQDKEKALMILDQFTKQWAKAAITNISGGGARFNSLTRLNQGDKVRIIMNLPKGFDTFKMELDAIIVASDKLLNRSDSYENRIQFIEVKPKDREELIKFIFELDRKRRRNEKS